MHLLQNLILILLYVLATPLSARPQFSSCVAPYTERVGDGDPHQDKYHQQVTDSITCGNGLCSMSDTETHTVSIGFTIGNGAGGSVKSPAQWIDAGFEVQESWSQSQIAGCNGAAGDTVCLWHRTDHTAYTVQNFNPPSGLLPCGELNPPPYVIRSPNKADYNNAFYCVRNNCRNKGDAYWEDGEAGGPSSSD